MKIDIFIERFNENKSVELKENSRVKDLLRELDISSNTVLVTVNNNLVVDTTALNDNDQVKLLSVVSGG